MVFVRRVSEHLVVIARVLLLVSRDVAEKLGVLTRRRTMITRRFTLSS